MGHVMNFPFIRVANKGIYCVIVLFHDRQELFRHRHHKHRDRKFVAGVWWDIATHLNINGKLFYYFIP
jgi:hypothetical protein